MQRLRVEKAKRDAMMQPSERSELGWDRARSCVAPVGVTRGQRAGAFLFYFGPESIRVNKLGRPSWDAVQASRGEAGITFPFAKKLY